MVKHRQIARRIKNEIRAEDCSEIAVNTIHRHLTISINGKLIQKTLIRSLVERSANKISVRSIDKAVEKVPCKMSVRYHLSKVDLDWPKGKKPLLSVSPVKSTLEKQEEKKNLIF